MSNFFHYPHAALQNLYLIGGVAIEDHPEYGQIVTFSAEDQLERSVALLVASMPRRLNGIQLRFLRRMLDLTQQELGVAVEKDGQTVARAEKQDGAIPYLLDLKIRLLFLVADAPSTTVPALASISEGKGNIPDNYYLKFDGGRWLAAGQNQHVATAKRTEKAQATQDAVHEPSYFYASPQTTAGSHVLIETEHATPTSKKAEVEGRLNLTTASTANRLPC